MVPANKKDLHLDSNSAQGKEKVPSVVNRPTSTQLNHHEDEDENGYVLIDDYVRHFPLPKSDEDQEDRVIKPSSSKACDKIYPLPNDKKCKGCFQALPERKVTRSQQLKLTSTMSMPPGPVNSGVPFSAYSRRSFVAKGNSANSTSARPYENSIPSGIGVVSAKSTPGCSNTSEMDNDIVYVLPENPGCTNKPMVGEHKNRNVSGHPLSENLPGMYDDIIPTTPVKLAFTNEPVVRMDQDRNQHEVDFVITQQNPAYAAIPHIYEDILTISPEYQIYTNNSVVDEDENYSGKSCVPIQTNPAYAATPEMYEDFISTTSKNSTYINEPALGEHSYDDERSIPASYTTALMLPSKYK